MKIALLVDARWGDGPEKFAVAGTVVDLSEDDAQRLLDAGLAADPDTPAAVEAEVKAPARKRKSDRAK